MSVGLSPMELRCLAEYARQGRQKDATQTVGISLHTFKNHITAAYGKLGAESLAEAASALGWLRVPEVAQVDTAVRAIGVAATLHEVAAEAETIASQAEDLAKRLEETVA
jgi:DNA-binding CsgD family transcriptional regulator